MIIKLALNNHTLTQYLTALGWETDMRPHPEAITVGHNSTEVVEYMRLHVKVDDKWELAEPFFEKLLDETLLYMIKSYKNQRVRNIDKLN